MRSRSRSRPTFRRASRVAAVAASLVVLSCATGAVAPEAPPPPAQTTPPFGPARVRAACHVAPPIALDLSLAGSCRRDADCTEGTRPRCAHVGTFVGPGKPKMGPLERRCVADACVVDGDCRAGELCFCGRGVAGTNVCGESQCEDDTDCGGRECAEDAWPPGPQPSMAPPRTTPHYCRTAADECRRAAECGPAAGCAFERQRRRFECRR